MPTQKELLENLTGEKMPEPTPQEQIRIQLENTPFWVIGTRTQGYSVIMGKYRMNKEPIGFGIFDEQTIIHEIEQWLEENKWNIQMSIAICVTTDLLNNQSKQ